MNIDKFSDSKPVVAVAADVTLETGTLTGVGGSIDTMGYRSLVVPVAVVRTTDGQLDSIKFEESEDNSVWTASDADENLYYPGSFPIDATGNVHVGCISKKRYVRLAFVASDFTSGSVVISSGLGLLMDSLTKPSVKESSAIADADVRSPGKTGDAESTPPKRT